MFLVSLEVKTHLLPIYPLHLHTKHESSVPDLITQVFLFVPQNPPKRNMNAERENRPNPNVCFYHYVSIFRGFESFRGSAYGVQLTTIEWGCPVDVDNSV